jgi:hypothetical protein
LTKKRQKPYRRKYGHLYYPDFVLPDKKGDRTMNKLFERVLRMVIRLIIPVVLLHRKVASHFEKKRELREKIKLGDTRWIAEQRIAECLRQCAKNAAARGNRFSAHKKAIKLDLSCLDLTDEALAELFEAFTGKQKESTMIDSINLSGNPQLTKLPCHIAWFKQLFELDVTDTNITVLPDWIHELKHVSVLRSA